MTEVLIVDGARTPFGSFGGALRDVSAEELGLVAAKEAIRRAGFAASQVDNVVLGNVIQSHKGAPYLARHVALRAGVPIETPALVVNRLCGSGLQAVISGAQSVKLGESEVGLVGGAENMSQAPYVLRQARWGMKMGEGVLADTLSETLSDKLCGMGMGITAENLAEQYSISREEQDEFAFLSQQRAAAAADSGRLSEEIVPVTLQGKKGEKMISGDEHIRPDTTREKLSQLNPVFRKGGTVTAGNSSGINDGAACLMIASEEAVRRQNVSPIGRIVSWAVCGVEPKIMGIGPAPASRLALERAGLKLEEMDLIEINEAFAAQYLAVEKELGLNREIVNVHGGAIALGHPVGASGTRILLSLLYELRRRGKKYGLASLCIGGGQGIALVVEAL
ncbi:acetyl-CoA C-acetyltransferase [Kroppenstedtia eburnea]|uniref:acetyl-CoA C-acetyltransferase n=1 Tax=Kroppenstedtia eburnea TaxID=714067 RepID=A0A1N7IY56_9BACL|nr:acetyl-CoA C-acetyltransferase [Kroppenstedtia eburnea]EGK13367.1 acetyl-CoA acetyltransferase [Desmospora sp. 8437]QKI82310.1 acetyl-CoA C-acetyltransferase [Kroppenstedtia eburnea]SIS41931.1 acetyl-CoA C-acetyltransferase [Kroppenstedtia eburnea]